MEKQCYICFLNKNNQGMFWKKLIKINSQYPNEPASYQLVR